MKFLRFLGSLSLLFSLMTMFFAVGPVGCSSAEKFDTSTPEGAYKQAEEFEKDERFEEAVAKYTDVKNKHPYSRFATLAEMKIADVHFKREAYIEAASAYQLFKEFHPKHPQADYVTYRLALSYFNQLPSSIDRDLSVADKAILYFDEVLTSFGTSQYAEDSKVKKAATLKMQAQKEMYIAAFYTHRSNWESALGRYETVLRKYPNLGLDSEALYGAARSAIRSGEKERGQQYLKTLYTSFPNTDEARRAKHELE